MDICIGQCAVRMVKHGSDPCQIVVIGIVFVLVIEVLMLSNIVHHEKRGEVTVHAVAFQ